MKKYLTIFSVLIVQIGLSQDIAANPDILKQTFVYAVKNDSSLALDIYSLKDRDRTVKKPAVLFMFGGAFVTVTEMIRFIMPILEP
jgi:hypothetical protein